MSPDKRHIVGQQSEFHNFEDRKELESIVNAKLKYMKMNSELFHFQDSKTKKIVPHPGKLKSIIDLLISDKI